MVSWSVPLFLFQSLSNQDTALLAQPPSSLALAHNLSLGVGGSWDNYTLVYDEPVAYGASLDSGPPSYPLVTLKAYWSPSRSDFQTTTLSLDELNAHGGEYDFVADVALVASTPGEGTEAASFTPLRLAYDSGRTDATLGPWSYADLNAMVDGVAFDAKEGRIDGFAHQGDCTACNISLSESFPSVGGADCAYTCASGHSSHTVTYKIGYLETDAEDAFNTNMKAAGKILESYGSASTESGTALHVSLNYFCCYSDYDFATIKSALSGIEWPDLNISFGTPAWRIDSNTDGKPDHLSAIVLLDDESQVVMHDWVAEVEEIVRAAGVDVHVPRADQEPFHSTLGVVDAASYPAEAAVAAIIDAIPPNSWSPTPITLPAGSINF